MNDNDPTPLRLSTFILALVGVVIIAWAAMSLVLWLGIIVSQWLQ